jgi:hypothetical protein
MRHGVITCPILPIVNNANQNGDGLCSLFIESLSWIHFECSDAYPVFVVFGEVLGH